MKVLFICKDNLGRSQAAEALFNMRAKTSKAESCAGSLDVKENFMLADRKLNKKVDDVIKIMKDDYKIDISKKVSKPFSLDTAKSADIVISMCSGNECVNIPNAEHWDIPNLLPLDFQGKREAIRTIDVKIRELLDRIEK